MKQLTCEMCGSTNVVKQDGMFVCQDCGTKYSVEEAKKMMIDGVVEVQGTVKVDNSELVDNYLSMASNALDASNLSEVEQYCNKVIEIEPNNAKAWLFKGKAAGWQSSVRNSRLQEAGHCFLKAIENSSRNELNENAKEAIKNYDDLLLAMLRQQLKIFESNPAGASGANSDSVSILTLVLSEAKSKNLWGAYNSRVEQINAGENENPIDMIEYNVSFQKNYATLILDACKEAFDQQINKLNNSGLDYNKPSSIGLEIANANIVGGIFPMYVFLHLYHNIFTVDENKADEIDGEQIKIINRICRDESSVRSRTKNLKSYRKQVIQGFAGPYLDYVEDKSFVDSFKNEQSTACRELDKVRDRANRKYESDRKRKEKEAFDKYWSEHIEERKALENELKSLNVNLESKENDIINIPEAKVVNDLQERISSLEKEKGSLGIFKAKEKKELQKQIEELTQKVRDAKEAKDKASAPFKEEISKLKTRIKEINTELTKNR